MQFRTVIQISWQMVQSFTAAQLCHMSFQIKHVKSNNAKTLTKTPLTHESKSLVHPHRIMTVLSARAGRLNYAAIDQWYLIHFLKVKKHTLKSELKKSSKLAAGLLSGNATAECGERKKAYPQALIAGGRCGSLTCMWHIRTVCVLQSCQFSGVHVTFVPDSTTFDAIRDTCILHSCLFLEH